MADYGKCECGCGEDAPRANRNFRRLGLAKGEPFRFISGHNTYKPGPRWDVVERGHDTPCWIWSGRLEENGYARPRINGVNVLAHRHQYQLRHGSVPRTTHLHHLCRNRACVNPDHLQPLSATEHIRMERAVLTEEAVREIKESLARFSGYGACKALADKYGMGVKTINDIKLGKTWRGV